VSSKLQLCQLEIPVFLYNLMCQSSLINWVSFVFCEFNRVVGWNEGKTIIYSIIISHSKIETLVSYSRSTKVNVNISFLIAILKETLVLMCLASYFDIIEGWKLIVGHRYIYYEKKLLKTFLCVEVRILVEKWNIYEGHIFARSLLQTCRLETTSLCLNARLLDNK